MTTARVSKLQNYINCLEQQLKDKDEFYTDKMAQMIQHFSGEISTLKKIIDGYKKQYKPIDIDEELIYNVIQARDKPNTLFFPVRKKEWGKSDTDMITLTFDPKKFDIQFLDDQQLTDYILTVCSMAFKAGIYYSFYGCIEKHKSGTIHAHVLYKTNHKKSVVYKFFKPLFTDDKTNNIAVKISEDISNCDYINKESKHYFWNKCEALDPEDEIINDLDI